MKGRDEGGLETIVHLALAAAAISAAVASFFGLRGAMDGAGAAERAIIPLVVSVAVAVGAWVLWHQLLRLARQPMVPHLRVLLLSLGLSLALVVAAMSAWWIAAAIGGSAALAYHEERHLEAVQKALDEAYEQRMREQKLQPVLSKSAAALRMAAEDERDGLGASGKAGDGVVARSIVAAAADFDELAAGIRAALDRASTQHRDAMERLDAARRRIADLGPQAAQGEIAAATGQVARIVADLQSGYMASIVKQSGVVIGSGGPAASSSQRRALRELDLRLEKHTAEAHAAADRLLEAQRPVRVPAYEPTNAQLAVWNHANVVPGPWIVGIAVDFMPFVMLLVLCLQMAAVEQPQDRRTSEEDADEIGYVVRPGAIEPHRHGRIAHADDAGQPASARHVANDKPTRIGGPNGSRLPDGQEHLAMP
ncbi:hypothetical protein [Benzoatithermus flavus]|uniref:DUF4407 domain-containing protein n=1 Tax=Benzoatithermus flavus TaxID=3108223 RepID=A0ABU8XL65_9PROT